MYVLYVDPASPHGFMHAFSYSESRANFDYCTRNIHNTIYYMTYMKLFNGSIYVITKYI